MIAAPKTGRVPTPKINQLIAKVRLLAKVERRGFRDAQDGITSNPFPDGTARFYAWNKGLQRFYGLIR